MTASGTNNVRPDVTVFRVRVQRYRQPALMIGPVEPITSGLRSAVSVTTAPLLMTVPSAALPGDNRFTKPMEVVGVIDEI